MTFIADGLRSWPWSEDIQLVLAQVLRIFTGDVDFYVVIVPKCQMYSMTIGLPIYVASAPLRRLPHSPCLAGSNNSGQKTHVAYPKAAPEFKYISSI